jgi:UDP-N-acetyl-D-glucosamine dehydrogenase
MLITVVGQGYVGLPLAIAASIAGHEVFGLDNDKKKIKTLISGKSLIEDLSDDLIRECIESKLYIPTSNMDVISQSKIVLICVPTPLSLDHKPDLTSLIEASRMVGQNLKQGTLVIVESTVEPGTCRNILLPLLKQASGLSGKDFELAFSPERIDPTNKKWFINNTPKLVSGLSENAVKLASNFYESFIESVTICSSLEIAETAKLLENSFRLVNISFINEIAIYCQKIGIDINEVISAAATKPYGFMPFYPSIGVGGHCIPVDPLYLANAARAVGAPTKFIDLADQVNNSMPEYFINRAEEILISILNKNILVIGISYKPNVADVRESRVAFLIKGLREKGANVYWHDDLVKSWKGEESVALSSNFNLAILATKHDYLDLNFLGNTPILDTRSSI